MEGQRQCSERPRLIGAGHTSKAQFIVATGESIDGADQTALRAYERIGKSLASVRRLEIITVLSGGELSVEDIARQTGMSVANTSQHLRSMLAARLLRVRKSGPYSMYRLSSDRVSEMYKMLQTLAVELDPELNTDRKWISIERLAERIKKRDEVVVLDARPEKEFKAGRIKSARNLPLDLLDRRMPQVGQASDVIVYGRTVDCMLARAVCHELIVAGTPVARLRGGFGDWKSAGYPVTRSARNR